MGTVAYACNPIVGEAEAEGLLWVGGPVGLHEGSEFQVSLGYRVRHCFIKMEKVFGS